MLRGRQTDQPPSLQQDDPEFRTSSAPVVPAPNTTPGTVQAAPEPTRTNLPALSPDARTVVDGSQLVAGEHFRPGKWVAVNATGGQCVWTVLTTRGARKEGGMGPGPKATQRPIQAGESLQTLGCGDWTWQASQ
jgi:hypothetical protein